MGTWLITGASSGIGKSVAQQALRNGHKVIGTTRDTAKTGTSFPELERNGGVWLNIDPGKPESEQQFAEYAQEHEIDVLINSAGYAFIGGLEDTSENEIRDQMEVNFYGPLRAVRAVLPSMRARKSGQIVLISSASGFIARPGVSTYAASKFAIEATHEALSHELKNFNISVLIVEPGAFRTPIFGKVLTPAKHQSNGGFSEAYRDTVVDRMVTRFEDIRKDVNIIKGDVEKAAHEIVKAVEDGHPFLRLPLGPDAIRGLEEKIQSLQTDLIATRAIASSTDLD